MLSTIDLIVTFLFNIINIFVKKFPKPRLREIKIMSKENIDNFYFLPATSNNNSQLKNRILSKHGKNHIYTVDVFYHLTPNVNKSLIRINKTYNIAKEDIKMSISKGRKINILGQSLGTLFAVKLSSEFQCEKLTLVVPGDKLGETAWESWLTGPNARMSGIKKEEYSRAYKEYDINKWAKKIMAKKIVIYLAGIDSITSAKRGARVAKIIKKCNKNTKVIKWWILGHMLTIVLSAWAIKKENEK